MRNSLFFSAILLSLAAVVFSTNKIYAQGSTFTYQGRLDNSGSPYTGTAEFQPTLWDAVSSGSQVAGNSPTSMVVNVTNGLFVLPLNFGSTPFNAGADRWLQLEVRTTLGPFTTVTPRQKLAPTPYALYSANAATANLATTATTANSVAAANIVGALAPTQLPNSVLTNNQGGVNLTGAFTGNGAGLSNLTVNALGVIATNTSIASWGYDDYGQRDIPPGLENVISLAAGRGHGLAVTTNHLVVAWGAGKTNDPSSLYDRGQAIVPPNLSNVIAVAAGDQHSVALKADGTIVAWGNETYGRTNVPGGLNNVRAIAAGLTHSLALKNDGTVVGWGTNNLGELSIPGGLNGVAAIGAGIYHSVALKSNGTVVVWGDNQYHQTNVPAGLNSVIAISAGALHTLALKSDGTVVAWGAGMLGDTGEPNLDQSIVPAGLSNVVAITAGIYHSVALKSDGTVTAWGNSFYGQTNSMGLNNLVGLAQGPITAHTLALRKLAHTPVALLDSDNTFNGNVTVTGNIRTTGLLDVAGDMRLNDGNLWFRGNGDQNNGLGWYGIGKQWGNTLALPDGPILFGMSGGALGTSSNGYKPVITWDVNSKVTLGDTSSAGGTLSLGEGFADRKLQVYEGGQGDMGMGVQLNQFRFYLTTFGGLDRFAFNEYWGGGNEMMSIVKPGKVGIGISNPRSTLDVRGDIRMGATGQYLAVGSAETNAPLRIIRGVITATGTIITGSGFTVAHPATGRYTITFSPGFSDLSTITVSADSQGGSVRTAMTDGATATTAGIRVYSVGSAPALTDAPVHFIAIGPR